MITDIDRASKNRYYKGKQVCYEGGLRYWTGVGEFFNEEDKYLHFTKEDAQDECDRRNKGIIDVIKKDGDGKPLRKHLEDRICKEIGFDK